MALVKAMIEILDPGAVDDARGLTQFIHVQFNPTEYALAKSATFAEIAIPGLDSPVLQFVRGQSEKLTLDLFLDTTENGIVQEPDDVSKLTKAFHELVRVQPKTHAAPRFKFTWGKGLSFEAVAESVTQRFTFFSPEGVPLRATVSLGLREYRRLSEQLKDLNLQSSDHTRTHVVRRGETLASVAANHYGDPRRWRVIADANPGADPIRPAPGIRLTVPPLDPRQVPA